MLRTPKSRFISSTHSGAWGKITQTDVFEEAIHAALGQLQADMPLDCTVPQQACDAHQQMAGARKYMELLCSLHTPQTPTKPSQDKGLNYQAGV